jgi:hypothetical protein
LQGDKVDSPKFSLGSQEQILIESIHYILALQRILEEALRGHDGEFHGCKVHESEAETISHAYARK